jgi:hypothetical protein
MSVERSNDTRATVRYELNSGSLVNLNELTLAARRPDQVRAGRAAFLLSLRLHREPAHVLGVGIRLILSTKLSKSSLNRLRCGSYAICAFLMSPGKTASVSMNNQGAFDAALLHLLNQGHRSVNSAGRSQLRALRGGKSAIGALIPDQLYSKTMEGKTVQQLLAANGAEFEPLRAHLSGATLPLLNELQDLHDRTGECLPSMFRDIVREGGQRIARMFGLSARLIQLWGAYRKLSGPRLQLKTPPVVLGGAGSGTSRYATDGAAIAVA